MDDFKVTKHTSGGCDVETKGMRFNVHKTGHKAWSIISFEKSDFKKAFDARTYWTMDEAVEDIRSMTTTGKRYFSKV